VIVWDAKTHEKVTTFGNWVRAVDVSADGTKLATGSDDYTLIVWSSPAGDRLIGPFEHGFCVTAVKFSPDGRRIATATYERESVRVYDGRFWELDASSAIW
jgi:WD40 repeat protein